MIGEENMVGDFGRGSDDHFVGGPSKHGGEGVEFGIDAHRVMLGMKNRRPGDMLGDGALRRREGGAGRNSSDGRSVIRNASVREDPGSGDNSSSKGVRGQGPRRESYTYVVEPGEGLSGSIVVSVVAGGNVSGTGERRRPTPRTFGEVGDGFGGVYSNTVLSFRDEVKVTHSEKRRGGGVSICLIRALGDECIGNSTGREGLIKIMNIKMNRFEEALKWGGGGGGGGWGGGGGGGESE